MSRIASNQSENRTLREVGRIFDKGDSTLREWIEKGVCGRIEEVLTECRKGKEVVVLTPAQIERIGRFILYRKHFPEGGIDGAVELLEQVESGDVDELIRALEVIEEQIADDLNQVQSELQSLHARKYGDAEIDPNDID